MVTPKSSFEVAQSEMTRAPESPAGAKPDISRAAAIEYSRGAAGVNLRPQALRALQL